MSGIQRHGAGWATGRLNPDLAHNPAVAVTLFPLDAHILAEHHPRQVFLGSLAKGLSFFRCVDALEANLVLLAVGIENGYRVAIGNAHHAAEQGVGVGNSKQ